MAKNEEEALLPQSLGKLEIVPTISSDQEHHTTMNLNPFILRNNEPEISSIERDKIFGPSCHCTQNASSKISTNKEFSVKKCASQFKPRKRHEFILKQPMLKTFARCLHHCHKETQSVISLNECNPVEKQNSLIEPVYDGTECWSLRSDFAIDFKTLNLSETEPCTSSSDLHKSNSFRYPQSERKLLMEYHEQQQQQSPSFTPNNNNDRINQQNISCSQQAMWKPTTNSDVTTDELACYFETIVHIPKKMSSMAEMMYI